MRSSRQKVRTLRPLRASKPNDPPPPTHHVESVGGSIGRKQQGTWGTSASRQRSKRRRNKMLA